MLWVEWGASSITTLGGVLGLSFGNWEITLVWVMYTLLEDGAPERLFDSKSPLWKGRGVLWWRPLHWNFPLGDQAPGAAPDALVGTGPMEFMQLFEN